MLDHGQRGVLPVGEGAVDFLPLGRNDRGCRGREVFGDGVRLSGADQVRLFSPKPAVAASVTVTCAVVPKVYSLNCFWFAGSVSGGGGTPSFTSVKVGSTFGTPFVDGPVLLNVNGVGPMSGDPP